MAKRILVPLDGSAAAEAVLPLIADAARGGGATVCLLHVAPVPDNLVTRQGRTVVYADQEMARLTAEAEDYLRTVEARLEGVAVESAVRFGDPANEILSDAEAFGADLIALTTESRGPIRTAAFWSVAEQVFRRGEIPVLLLRAGRPAAGTTRPS